MKNKIEDLIETLNPKQKEAVLSDKNTVVSAGAGSGKTLVLALRYVRLILEGKADVENILTVTFTRKAAAEMYERIYSLLLQFQDDPLIETQLPRFDRARISTLDSFCTAIARDGSPRFGIPPSFTQDEYENQKLIHETSLRFLLQHSDNRVMKRLVLVEGFDRVVKDLFAALAEKYLPIGVEKDFEAMVSEQFFHLRSLLLGSLESIEVICERILSLDDKAAKAIADACQAIGTSLGEIRALTASMREEGPPREPGDGPVAHQKAARIVDGVSLSKRTGNSKKADVILYKGCVDEYNQVAERIADIAATLDERGYLEELFSLCSQFQNDIHREKQRRGVLSYADVQSMALETLRGNDSLRDFYKRKFRYIMIDEFQDNNKQQKELLYLLAERPDRRNDSPLVDDLDAGKLFFVGDEKQSIYRFRGADVSVFRELGEELAGPSGRAVSLSTNYRSEPDLVGFFNSFFGSVFENSQEKYEARFEPLTGREAWSAFPPKVALFYKPYEEGEGEAPLPNGEAILPSDEAEAFHIARYIEECVESGLFVPVKREDSRAVRYSDFALLMRSTGNQVIYERMFRRFGIPYTTQNVRTLFLEAPANDIYNLLQCVVYPEDRSAYAGLLRSPLVNVSDPFFVRLMMDDAPAFAFDPDNPTEMKRGEGPRDFTVDREDRVRYEKGMQMYRDVREKADTAPLTELIYDVWYTYGYRYLILKEPSLHSYLEFYDYLWSLAAEADRRGDSLAVFLDFLRSNLGKYEKLEDLEILKDNPEGVRIMTVHKSKGLEFPVVILANMGNIGRRGDERRAPFYLCDEFGLTFNLTEEDESGQKKRRYNYFYSRAEEEDKKKELAELKRLLYVAATRAQFQLILSGVHNRRNRNESETSSNLLNIALRAFENIGSEGPTVTVERIMDITEKDIHNHTAARNGSDLQSMVRLYENASVIEYRYPKKEHAAIEFDSSPGSEAAVGPDGQLGSDADMEPHAPVQGSGGGTALSGGAEFGTLCHYILEQMLDSWSTGGKTGDFAGIIDLLPPSLTAPFPPKKRDSVIQEAAALAGNFFTSEAGALLRNAVAVETEVPFLLREVGPAGGKEGDEGERFINGRIDLIIEGAEKVTIIDFKSDHTVVPEQYRRRMELYRQAVEALFEDTGKQVECALYYLRRRQMVPTSSPPPA